MTRTAEHRPATRRRLYKHDEYDACDLFSGFGGLSGGIERAGFTTITAANHNRYKVGVHEANFPHAEHWIADLVDEESPTYHDVRDLPAATLLAAGVSCTNHSQANSQKAYEHGLTLFDLDDPDYDARVTRSERDRATANCVLAYARVHHPLLILAECTTQLASWGPAIPGRPKIGDGSTYRWWLKQFDIEGYDRKILYLNSMFFGVGQSRDRGYWVFYDKRLPAPDLEHRPAAWCDHCQQVVEGVWTWRTGIPPTGKVCYGEQYNYRCPRCRGEVFPAVTPSLDALDLTNLGTRIGDKPVKKHRDGSTGPYAASTMERAERCRQRAVDFPAVLVPSSFLAQQEGHPWQPAAEENLTAVTGSVIAGHRHNGDGQHITRPMDTVTGTHEKAALIASTGVVMGAAGNTFERPGSNCRSRGLDEPLWTQPATNSFGLLAPPLAVAVDNYQGLPRGAGEPLPTQGGSETFGVLSAGVVPLRKSSAPVAPTGPLPTATGSQTLGLLTAAGRISHNGPIGQAKYRAHPVSEPLGTVVGTAVTQAALFSGWFKQNGTTAGHGTAPHPLSDPFGTLTGRDTTAVLTADWAEYREAVSKIPLEDWWYKMLGPHEVGRGCGFDVSFPGYGYEGSFVVWGSARDQVDGYGNAVSPQVGEWIGLRLRPILDTREAAA
jgi:DNA (cytosine-5)-methyltransferase 1